MLIDSLIQGRGPVFTVAASATLQEASRELDSRRVGALVALDSRGEVAGVLSERDIIRHVGRSGAAALELKVSDAMTRQVVTVSRDASVDQALACMTDRRIRHLPVIEGGRLVAIVSIGDLVKHKIAAAEAETEAMKAYILAG